MACRVIARRGYSDFPIKIWRRNYEQVKLLLSDPNVPVNEPPLPLLEMYSAADRKMARIFLDCPRIDWLAPTWIRKEVVKIKPKRPQTWLDNFYFLSKRFVRTCPEEAQEVYERIVDDVVLFSESENREGLLFRAVKSVFPFKSALKYSQCVTVKDEQGKSLLHHAHEPQVIRLLLDKGADINALDSDELTPLMVKCKSNHWPAAHALIKSGADCEFVNSRGETMFTVCQDRLSFLKHLKLTEKLFSQELRTGRSFNSDELEAIFKKYPEYKKIFEADLLLHLPAVPDWHKTPYTEFLSGNEYLKCCKNAMKAAGSKPEMFTLRPNLTKTFANELLAAAFQMKRDDMIIELIQKYEAAPNTIVDGKTLLFGANERTLVYLLEKTTNTLGTNNFNSNANPLAKCDGFLFFERDNFMKDLKEINAKWLIKLHNRGFDLFDKETKSGKCLIDYLNQEVKVHFDLITVHFRFPVSKLTKEVFESICKGKVESIDEEGNTMFHYTTLNDCGHKTPSLEALKCARNNSGERAYDKLLKIDELFSLGRNFYGEDFKEYLNDYNAYHGTGWIRQYGGELFLYAIAFDKHLELARYLLEDGKLALDRLFKDKKIREQVFEKSPSHNYSGKKLRLSDEGLCLLLEFGLEPDTKVFDYIFWSCFDKSLKVFIDSCQDVNSIIRHVADKMNAPYGYYWDSLFKELFEAFFSHPKVRNARFEENGNSCNLLDLLYFYLCNNRENLLLFESIGVNARNLFDSGIMPIAPPKPTVKYWETLKKRGWTMEEFEKFGFSEFFHSDDFKLAYTQRGILDNDLLWSQEDFDFQCAICTNNLREGQDVTMLTCEHLFHTNCIKNKDSCPSCD